MLYLITTDQPINYNSKYLVGAELLKRIDDILNQNLTDSNLYNNLVSKDTIDSNSFHATHSD